MIEVSVVIPTRRRPALLGGCLAALAVQSLDPRRIEVIVVDDGCDGGTEPIICAWRPRLPGLRYLAQPCPAGPAAARNRGWRAARGPIVAFTDDDCLPGPDWLQSGLAAFTAGVDGVGGRMVVPTPVPPTDYERNAALLEGAEFVTANCFYRRAALEAAGGFDERFTAAWREDTDLAFTLLERGCRLVRAPEAVVVHPVRSAPWGISLRQQRKSQFNALLYRKHPALYRRRIQSAPPWHYYLTLGALLAALVGLLTGRRSVRDPALALWLGLTGRFTLRRLRHTSRAPLHVVEMALTSALIPPLAICWRLRGAVKHRVFFL